MKVLFLSDLHLGANYIADSRAHENRVVDFLRHEGSDADHIYLLGDVLDYWYEYRTVVPRGFVRFFGELARLADSGVKITWMTGNHDIWLFDYLRDEIGMEVIDAPFIIREIGGQRFLLAHGDRIGRTSAGFRFICTLFRNRVCQRMFSAVHPGLTVGFAKRWSHSSRLSGTETEEQRSHHIDHILTDANAIAAANPGVEHIVHGHHHIAMTTPLDRGNTDLTVLGDWITQDTYAEFDGTKLELKRYK